MRRLAITREPIDIFPSFLLQMTVDFLIYTMHAFGSTLLYFFNTSTNHSDLIPQHCNLAPSKVFADICWMTLTACRNSNSDWFCDCPEFSIFSWKTISSYCSHKHLVPSIFEYFKRRTYAKLCICYGEGRRSLPRPHDM